MKIFVIYDESGKIKSTFATANENVGIRAAKDRKIHTFEEKTREGAALKQYLRELHAKYGVVGSENSSRLEKINE